MQNMFGFFSLYLLLLHGLYIYLLTKNWFFNFGLRLFCLFVTTQYPLLLLTVISYFCFFGMYPVAGLVSVLSLIDHLSFRRCRQICTLVQLIQRFPYMPLALVIPAASPWRVLDSFSILIYHVCDLSQITLVQSKFVFM